ncbi:hypothetical protein SUGI_0313180 [Cryptomeria japonica]|uniref:3-ketoacyl-CoA synthase 11 n=1 Tax=Cryptomeria japonica TaxID=3369 RepID=UPI002408A4BD|nr:3-ketoacyl-CoA synthase 11 [Cryptomeria japonica]GLJ17888.1 hypothetical protein SUGI_0313180 [Cryptomeria japonica]
MVALATMSTFFHILNKWATDVRIAITIFWVVSCGLLVYRLLKPRRIFMVGFSCFKPADDMKCNYELLQYLAMRTEKFSDKSVEFMKNIYLKSGIGEETYFPPFFFKEDPVETLEAAREEAEIVIFGAVDEVFENTGLRGKDIDVVVVACSMYSASPSLAALLVYRYGMKEDVKILNFAGMGCSSGVIAIQTASDLLRTCSRSGYALVVITENITLNTYYGENRSMLVTNSIFRVGCSAVVLSSRAGDRSRSKLELLQTLRTHRGADDKSYRAAFQEEDEDGHVGISLTKDLIRVAGEGLHDHIRSLAPMVLPYSEQLKYVLSLVGIYFLSMEIKPYVPDFRQAFDHFCIHTGGKAVINKISGSLRLSEYLVEPARMVLHRFGNTSSSLVMYQLAYFEAKKRIKKGDKVWMIAFGTGFKCNSIVWKALCDLGPSQSGNPWVDVVHRYPVC